MDLQKSEDEKTEKPEGEDKDPVLIPSEIELGMKVMIVKKDVKDTMKRLYAVPSEKLRVWTCWLNKVGDRADDWQLWLRAQIRLTVRISDLLRKATLALEAKKNEKSQEGDGTTDNAAGPEVATEPEDVTEFDVATEPKENETDTPTPAPTEIREPESTPPAQEALPQEENVSGELGNTEAPEGESETKEPGDENGDPKGSEEMGDKNSGEKGKETETKGQEEPDPKIEYKEGFWPVGVRWKPVSQRANLRPPPQRLPDEIPIPGNEEDMMDLVRKIRHQGVVYRSLYKHWSETAEQAVKEIVGRPILPTSQIFPNGEDVPYFFYLGASEDMDYVIEHDDEEVLARDPERERITQNFRHLYFNLSDKPGKGGKPWI